MWQKWDEQISTEIRQEITKLNRGLQVDRGRTEAGRLTQMKVKEQNEKTLMNNKLNNNQNLQNPKQR